MRVRTTPNPRRRGVQMLETAIVLPVVLMLTLGTCLTAPGIYYYELVATLRARGLATPRSTAPSMRRLPETRQPRRQASTLMPFCRWRSVSTQVT